MTRTKTVKLMTTFLIAALSAACSPRNPGLSNLSAPAKPLHSAGPILNSDAGGSDRGGGGTTNPQPIDPELIATMVATETRQILIPWLIEADIHFHNLSKNEQIKSPFAKLFAEPGEMIGIVKSTKVELRFSKPCLDKNGAPWDGSIYANQPKAICLSPFLMAPKLSIYNADKETMALVLHELSHLVGTTEPEARAIQELALKDFVTFRFEEVIWAQSNLLGEYGKLPDLISLLRQPFRVNGATAKTGLLSSNLIAGAFNTYEDIGVAMSYGDNLNFTDIPGYGLLNAQQPRFYIARDWSCAHDPDRNLPAQVVCQSYLDRAFAGQATQSSVTVEDSYDGAGSSKELDFAKEYTIANPQSLDDVLAQLNETADDLQTLENSLSETYLTKTELIRN